MPIVSARMHFTRVKGSEIRSSFLGYLKGVHVRTKTDGGRVRPSRAAQDAERLLGEYFAYAVEEFQRTPEPAAVVR